MGGTVCSIAGQGSPASILVSIREEWWERIRDGEKEFEFRRTVGKRPVKKIYFAVCGTAGVAGEAAVLKRITGSPEEMWQVVDGRAGMSRYEFMRYCGVGRIYAYVLGKVTPYAAAIPLSTWNISRMPQSWQYIE